MIDDILQRIFVSEWRVIAIVALLLLVLARAGFVIARRHRETSDAHKGQVTGMQTAILGLLALLLGFTFAMALGRYESRRDLVLQEANAIGTAYLRASLLPGTHQKAVEDLLRRYVALRIPLYEPETDPARLSTLEAQSSTVQRELWAQLVGAARESPTPITATFVTALNEMIDLDASRVHALRSHVPGAAWLIVIIVAAVGIYVSGYAAGISQVPSAFSTLLLPLLLAVVITLISDLDAPRQGLIGITKQPLLDLQQSLQKPGGG
jgi:uncharacterized membrane protein